MSMSQACQINMPLFLTILSVDLSYLAHLNNQQVSLHQCAEAQPCYKPSACVNTAKGFTCESCPPGLWGPPLSGVGVEYAKSHRQVQFIYLIKDIVKK